MRSQGFEPVALATYKPRQTLRVLIGRPKASSTGIRGRRAFFFVREQYIGTDAASPSLRLKVASQRGGEITLAYRATPPATSRAARATARSRCASRWGTGACAARPDPADGQPPAALLT